MSLLVWTIIIHFYVDIVRGGPNVPVAIRKTLGWAFCGQTGDGGQECSVSMNVQVCSEEQSNHTLKNFWNLEYIGIMPVKEEASISDTEERVLQNFKHTLILKDGCFEVLLPWKEEKADLKDNYKQAEHRLSSLERKLVQDPDKAKCYR